MTGHSPSSVGGFEGAGYRWVVAEGAAGTPPVYHLMELSVTSSRTVSREAPEAAEFATIVP